MLKKGTGDEIWRANWPDVLSSMTRIAALLIGGLALVFSWKEIENIDARWLTVIAWLALVILAVLVVAILAEARARLAALLLVVGSTAVPALLLAEIGGQFAVCHFILPALTAGMLFTLVEGGAIMIGMVALLAVLSGRTGVPLDWGGFVAFVALPSLTASAMQRVLRQELARAWRYSDEAGGLAAQVRIRREEVNKLNKALHLSNYLLKRSNHELRLARLEAEEARHAKERFATCVSHELRTPLNIILGLAEMMQKYPEVYGGFQWPPLLRHDVAEIQRSARYLSNLIDDILDLARVQALRMPIHREWTDLRELLEDTADMARRLVHNKPVTVQIECAANLPQLFVDRTRIRQVLLNSLANASRFTEQGSITVGARDNADEIIAFVRDTGAGIPAQQLEKIFEEFRQVDDLTVDGEKQGSGLGLAVARRFVQMHGGRIWAESEMRAGTTIYFSLPLAAKQVSLSTLPDLGSAPASPDKPAIVVVDKDASASAYLTRWLDGFVVLSAADLAEAKSQVLSAHPRVVLLNLPSSPQFDAYASTVVNEVGSWALVVRCSLPFGAWLFDEQLFHSWLVKPVTADQLAGALQGVSPAPRVLLVDDDRVFVQLLVRMLRTQRPDALVDWVYTAEDALMRLREEDWDVMLVDIALPDLDGRSLARLARPACTNPNLRILAVSGMQPGEDRDQLVSTSFSIAKRTGLSESELLALLRSAITIVSPPLQSQENASEPTVTPGETPAL